MVGGGHINDLKWSLTQRAVAPSHSILLLRRQGESPKRAKSWVLDIDAPATTVDLRPSVLTQSLSHRVCSTTGHHPLYVSLDLDVNVGRLPKVVHREQVYRCPATGRLLLSPCDGTSRCHEFSHRKWF